MPLDRGALDTQLREIGEGDRWWEFREFRDLPHILHVDEKIQGLTSGRVLGGWRPKIRPVGRWLIVATNLRLICLKQDRFARRQIELAAGQITRIYGSSRLRTYQIVVETPQRRVRLRIPKDDAFRFAAVLDPLVAVPPVHRVEGGAAPRPLLPGIGALAALPGMRGLGRPSPDEFASRAHADRLEAAVEHLQNDVERLRQQVAFLEDLLQKQAEETFLHRTSAHS
ncbi:MAG TPA: hypothetical protein VFQ39_10525 [Longimicrobium sp.]|nr:hypothetical protein [Longimicrobium sp.]